MWEVKFFFKISVHWTWNPAILQQQGAWNYANLVFDEPHQLTEFAS